MSRLPKLSSLLVKSIATVLVTNINTAPFQINDDKFTPAVLLILLALLSILLKCSAWSQECRSQRSGSGSENNWRSFKTNQKTLKEDPEFFREFASHCRLFLIQNTKGPGSSPLTVGCSRCKTDTANFFDGRPSSPQGRRRPTVGCSPNHRFHHRTIAAKLWQPQGYIQGSS